MYKLCISYDHVKILVAAAVAAVYILRVKTRVKKIDFCHKKFSSII